MVKNGQQTSMGGVKFPRVGDHGGTSQKDVDW